MQLYVHCSVRRLRGRPPTSLAMTIDKDLSCTQDRLTLLRSKEELDHLLSLAQDHDQWRWTIEQITEIAEAFKSDLLFFSILLVHATYWYFYGRCVNKSTLKKKKDSTCIDCTVVERTTSLPTSSAQRP